MSKKFFLVNVLTGEEMAWTGAEVASYLNGLGKTPHCNYDESDWWTDLEDLTELKVIHDKDNFIVASSTGVHEEFIFARIGYEILTFSTKSQAEDWLENRGWRKEDIESNFEIRRKSDFGLFVRSERALAI